MAPPNTLSKIHQLLPQTARRELTWLCAIAIGAGFLESIAVASIMPFLATLFHPELANSDVRLARLSALFGASNQSELLAYLGGAILFIIVTANAFSACTTWLMLRFANRQGHALSVRLLASYLAKPYLFYLDHHTAELQKNLFGEVQRVTGGILIPLAHIVAKLSVVTFIAALLVLINPLMALIVAVVLGGAYSILYKFVRATLNSVGRELVEAGALRARHGIESLAGAKEIKLLGREAKFIARFDQPSLHWANAQAKAQALSLLPRYAVETVAISLILVLAIYLLGTKRGTGELLPLLGLYAFAGYRLMPALQAVFAGLASIRHSSPALDVVLDDLALSQHDLTASTDRTGEVDRMPLCKEVALRDVCFRYPGESRWALGPLNLRIPKNSSIALVGATGCGKTTVVDVLMGLLRPEKGRLEVDEIEIIEANVRQWQRNIGHVSQQIFLCDDSIARNIALGLPDEEIDWAQVEYASRAHGRSSVNPGIKPESGPRGNRRARDGNARAHF